jgi:Alw26I/Eco31I/Esp3I family type II restriction m6 adenine DNA methyltransferase
MNEDWPGMELDDLNQVTLLAILRRLLLQTLWQRGLLPANLQKFYSKQLPNLDIYWKFLQTSGCPLLSIEFESLTDFNPRQAMQYVKLPKVDCDLGQAFQELKGIRLTRENKRDLVLSGQRFVRRRAGLFFTPEWMANDLSQLALSANLTSLTVDDYRTGLRILDPACGSGRLLMACLERMLVNVEDISQRASLIRSWVPEVVRGIELDPLAVCLTRSFIWMAADPRLGEFPQLKDVIVCGDALLESSASAKLLSEFETTRDRFKLIIANPPFDVLSGFKRRPGLEEYVQRIRKSGYRLALHGTLNTYRLFLEKSLQLIDQGDGLAFVMPFSFLMDRNAAPLRKHMLNSGWIRELKIYPESSKTFKDVGQSVVLLGAVMQSKKSPKLTVVDGTDPGSKTKISISDLVTLDAEEMPIPVLSSEAFGLAAQIKKKNTCRISSLAEGRVGEVDQTFYREYIKSGPSSALLLRGTHLSPFHAELGIDNPKERWLDKRGFYAARKSGSWTADIEAPRIVQTGIVNMEAGRRLVAAKVGPQIFLGNSINYWVPQKRADIELESLYDYLLGLLNSWPIEWRFRLTSSNNNINLYEVRQIPVPKLVSEFAAEKIPDFLGSTSDFLAQLDKSAGAKVSRITKDKKSPRRRDRVVAMLIGRLARARERSSKLEEQNYLDGVLDNLISWHLGLAGDGPDFRSFGLLNSRKK